MQTRHHRPRVRRRRATASIGLREEVASVLYQPVHRPDAGAETIGLDAETLQHAHKELAEGRIVPRAARDVPAVAVTAACEQNRQVRRAVAAGVAEIAADEDLRAVQQRAGALLYSAQRQQE